MSEILDSFAAFASRNLTHTRITPLIHCITYRNLICSKEVVEDRDEQAEFESGPLSVLMQSVKQNTQVLSIIILDAG